MRTTAFTLLAALCLMVLGLGSAKPTMLRKLQDETETETETETTCKDGTAPPCNSNLCKDGTAPPCNGNGKLVGSDGKGNGNGKGNGKGNGADDAADDVPDDGAADGGIADGDAAEDAGGVNGAALAAGVAGAAALGLAGAALFVRRSKEIPSNASGAQAQNPWYDGAPPTMYAPSAVPAQVGPVGPGLRTIPPHMF